MVNLGICAKVLHNEGVGSFLEHAICIFSAWNFHALQPMPPSLRPRPKTLLRLGFVVAAVAVAVAVAVVAAVVAAAAATMAQHHHSSLHPLLPDKSKICDRGCRN